MTALKMDISKCQSNHLTPFGAGLVTAPNTIDFDYVFANASFANNLAIYVSLMLIYLVFIILLLWSRYMDRQVWLPDDRSVSAVG